MTTERPAQPTTIEGYIEAARWYVSQHYAHKSQRKRLEKALARIDGDVQDIEASTDGSYRLAMAKGTYSNAKYDYDEYRHHRRKPTLKERLTPCVVCEYPISHRHHLSDMVHFGENDDTVQLCANCHELYHIMYDCIAHNSKRAQATLKAVLFTLELSHDTVKAVIGIVIRAVKADIRDDVIKGLVLSTELISARTGWEDYINRINDERREIGAMLGLYEDAQNG